jgi:hypothetical protein
VDKAMEIRALIQGTRSLDRNKAFNKEAAAAVVIAVYPHAQHHRTMVIFPSYMCR